LKFNTKLGTLVEEFWKGGIVSMQKKKRSRFQKITMVAVWVMIISMVGSLIFGAVAGLGLY
jgi:cell division septal protein FtsQ